MEPQYKSSQRMYDQRAEKYDDSHHPAFAKRVVQAADLEPGNNVLDLACGTGGVTLNAAATVGDQGHVIGVDVSTGMLAQAISKIKAANVSNVDIYQHDIACLNSLDAIKGRTFDAITLASALVLLDDPEAAIQQWVTFMKPGACFVVDVLSKNTIPRGLIFERTGKRLGLKFPYNRDWVKSSDSLKNILEEAGLVVEKMLPMEQTGADIDYLDVADAEKYFDDEVDNEAYKVLATVEVRDKARAVFKEEFEKMAVDGKVKVEDLVWVAVARKPA